MLNEIKEKSINLWSPVGDIFSSISDVSNIWFPIITYIFATIVSLIIIKKILDMSVSGATSLDMQFVWTLIKKLILYTLIISIATVIVVSLYFYLESLYDKHEEETIRVEQSVDYLLL